MNYKPIFFKTVMVQAILSGRKCVTRRIIKESVKIPTKSDIINNIEEGLDINFEYRIYTSAKDMSIRLIQQSPYQVDDIVYVRETFKISKSGDVIYRADDPKAQGPWTPSIHMPKAYARVFLQIKEVSYSKLQGMTLNDFEEEGFDIGYKTPGDLARCIVNFRFLWNSTLTKDKLKNYSYEDDPYVWIYRFEVCDEPKDFN